MHIKRFLKLSLPLLLLLIYTGVYAEDTASSEAGNNGKPAISVPETKITYQWFLSYADGKSGDEAFSEFLVNRGYINITSKFSPLISTRITPDLTVDREGDGEGDLEMRFKYCYIQFHLPSSSFFTDPSIEFGLVHRPWLDFEEHINYYRAQGTMFLERNHIFNSADNGVTFMTLFAGKVSREYRETVNGKYPGRYGSMSFGIYNGGGYHALEKNLNKVLEGRLTVRPLPDYIPGLQFSYFLVRGKGNIAVEPDWNVDVGFISLESRRFVLTAQYYSGDGNTKGNAVYESGRSSSQNGYSLFGELKIPERKISIISRYDNFDHDTQSAGLITRRTIAGIAYHIQGHHKAILDYDFAELEAGEEDSTVKFTIEVHF